MNNYSHMSQLLRHGDMRPREGKNLAQDRPVCGRGEVEPSSPHHRLVTYQDHAYVACTSCVWNRLRSMWGKEGLGANQIIIHRHGFPKMAYISLAWWLLLHASLANTLYPLVYCISQGIERD